MAKKRPTKRKKEPKQIRVPVHVIMDVPDDGTPYYANYAEATFGTHECLISFGTVPTKLSAKKTEEAKSGSLHIDALVQVIIPPSLLPGLIRALITTKEGFEKSVGPIKDAEETNA